MVKPTPHEPDAGLDRRRPTIAVLVPCYNEAATIETVVHDFHRSLPDADVYVYDNNSSDGTASVAAAAGAIVRREPLQGKGNVVRRMFADIDADIYVMVDGDATYDAASAPKMIDRMLAEHLDMVTGVRRGEEKAAFRRGHRFGNWMFSTLITVIFGDRVGDLLSGYRVFSRRFVKSFPALSGAFEIETELTVHALELRMPLGDVDTPYGARPEGSVSKLSTVKDGIRILSTVLELVKNERPLPLFGGLGAAMMLLALILGLPLVLTFLETGLVPRVPTAIIVVGLSTIGIGSLFTGIVMDSVTRGRQELKRLSYLAHGPVAPGRTLDAVDAPQAGRSAP